MSGYKPFFMNASDGFILRFHLTAFFLHSLLLENSFLITFVLVFNLFKYVI